ncbi:MAG: hypothetical protein RLZZ301_1617 [Bacteroidota bacterium]|jgi:hypothetical protein
MVRYALGLIVILTACAQVGTITGGPEDMSAPQVRSANLKDGQTNVQQNQFRFEFDEWIKLNKPTETISLMPADSRLVFSTKKNQLQIELSDPLQANTTYTLLFNRAIQDFTEANDSVFSYCFSTGSVLDSIRLAVRVKMATTGSPAKKTSVGLYETDTSMQARYLAAVDESGLVCFNALKAGNYYLKAISQAQEMDAIFTPLDLNKSLDDTLVMALSKINQQLDSVQVNEVLAGGTIRLKINQELAQGRLRVLKEGKPVRDFALEGKQQFLLEQLEAGTYQFQLYFDTNQNGKWDAIRPTEKLRAEEIYNLTSTYKVRANWDLDITLRFNF